MLSLLAALALALPPPAGDAPQADPKRVQAAVSGLEKAWKSENTAERVRALQASVGLGDAALVKLVARGLRDREAEVQQAAIEVLRFAEHPDALKELEALAREERPLRKDPALFAALLRAIGQYGSAGSIRLLGDDLWSNQDARVQKARILGLGRIRTREALERLLELLKSAGPQRIDACMPDFRLALAALSGTDQGNFEAGWQQWWSEHRAQWKPEVRRPALPRDLERSWQVYWGESEGDDRPRKRSERGRD